jgi:outer membrane protein OmpU
MKTIRLVIALTLLPSLAQSDIVLSGQAKMGLRHESGKTFAAAGTRVTAQFSRTTDGGLEYGAIIDLDQTATGLGAVFDGDDPRAQVYISGGHHSLTLGKGTESASQSLFD